MSATHTPGPWKLDSNPLFHRNRVWTQDMRPIVNLCSMSMAPSEHCPEAQANARLIAAAPDLLAAAIDALSEINALRDWIDDHVPPHLITSEDWGKLHRPIVTTVVARNLRAAIGRATPTAEGVA